MDSLSGIFAFVRTAETLSFVGAGRALGVSASAVGKNVARLEQSVGVRLFQRSTRRVSLTEEGALLYERCRRILDDLQDAEAMLSQAAERPRGRLRVSVPTVGHHFLLPHLPEFGRLYPEVEFDLDFNDVIVDVIEEGVDAVIRSGDLPDSRLMSRRLGPFRFALTASPAYLARQGRPRTPSELAAHACLRFRFPTTGKLQAWSLLPDPSGAHLRLPASFTCNNIDAVLAAAKGGLGIAHVPDFLVRESLADGSLCSVLDDYLDDGGQFWALWPSSRHLSPKVRVFIDFIATRLFKEAG